jgi:hemerythrin-like domain-containing protein
MSFHEIRDEILAEHRQLGAAMKEVEVLCERLEAGDAATAERLISSGRALYERFAAHLAREDRILLPSLEQVGGCESSRRLLAEHREQRELLSYLLGRISQTDRPALLASRELRQFGALLREDMDREERTLLHPEGQNPPVVPEPERRTR